MGIRVYRDVPAGREGPRPPRTVPRSRTYAPSTLIGIA